MTKRGRILRDTSAGPGLLSADGQQYTFVLEGMWRSEVPPRTGMPVQVDFNDAGAPCAVAAIPEGQLAREQANQAISGVKNQSGAIAQKTLRRFGMGTVIAFLALIAGWFLLTTISLGNGREGIDLTFWQLLGYANDSHSVGNFAQIGPGFSPSSGIFGLFALVALAGPLLRFFWADRRAALAGVLPLLLMILVVIVLRSHIVSAAGAMDDLGGSRAASEMMDRILKLVTVGMGAYVSLLSSLYFAYLAIKRFLIAGA